MWSKSDVLNNNHFLSFYEYRIWYKTFAVDLNANYSIETRRILRKIMINSNDCYVCVCVFANWRINRHRKMIKKIMCKKLNGIPKAKGQSISNFFWKYEKSPPIKKISQCEKRMWLARNVSYQKWINFCAWINEAVF